MDKSISQILLDIILPICNKLINFRYPENSIMKKSRIFHKFAQILFTSISAVKYPLFRGIPQTTFPLLTSILCFLKGFY